MIEIKMPKEILDFKEKFLFGLTVRQFISVAAALAVCIPLYIFGADLIGADITGWLIIVIAAPLFGFGFFKYNGLTFEKFLAVLYRQKIIEPQKRKYVELPVFWEIRENIIANEIAHQKAAEKSKKGKNSNELQKR